jgi:hypothetical protein
MSIRLLNFYSPTGTKYLVLGLEDALYVDAYALSFTDFQLSLGHFVLITTVISTNLSGSLKLSLIVFLESSKDSWSSATSKRILIFD